MWYGSGAIVSLFYYMRARLHTEKEPCRLSNRVLSTAGRNASNRRDASNSRDANNSMVDNNSMYAGKRRNPSKIARTPANRVVAKLSCTERTAGKPAISLVMA